MPKPTPSLVPANEQELETVLRWIIDRIESEADKTLSGGRPNWKKAATEAVEEAYGVLSVVQDWRQAKAAKKHETPRKKALLTRPQRRAE